MITRFITEVNTKINPFSAQSKSARLFLTTLPPAARSQGMIIQTKLLPRAAAEKNSLQVKFSKENTSRECVEVIKARRGGQGEKAANKTFFFLFLTEDGKLLDLDCETMGIKSLIEECDRHSRALQKQADLAES